MTATEHVITSYSLRAKEYAEILGNIKATKKPDQDLIKAWCSSVSGQILDLGCGPGHWTNFLASHGKLVRGVDPTPLFIELATQKYPGDTFQIGTIAGTPADSYQGVLAWYSLIHLAPEKIEQELSEIYSALTTNGSLLIGYFRGPNLELFDHAVAQAWFWPDTFIIGLLEKVGFVIMRQEHREDSDARPHGAIIAAKLL